MTEKKMMSGMEYLNQIQEAKARVRKLCDKIRNLEAMATDDAYHLTGPIGHGQTDRDKTGTLIAKKCDAERELEEAEKVEIIKAEALFGEGRIEPRSDERNVECLAVIGYEIADVLRFQIIHRRIEHLRLLVVVFGEELCDPGAAVRMRQKSDQYDF